MILVAHPVHLNLDVFGRMTRRRSTFPHIVGLVKQIVPQRLACSLRLHLGPNPSGTDGLNNFTGPVTAILQIVTDKPVWIKMVFDACATLLKLAAGPAAGAGGTAGGATAVSTAAAAVSSTDTAETLAFFLGPVLPGLQQ